MAEDTVAEEDSLPCQPVPARMLFNKPFTEQFFNILLKPLKQSCLHALIHPQSEEDGLLPAEKRVRLPAFNNGFFGRIKVIIEGGCICPPFAGYMGMRGNAKPEIVSVLPVGDIVERFPAGKRKV